MFRKATPNDIPSLKALARSVIRHNYTPFLGEDAVESFIGSGASDEEIEKGLERCVLLLESGDIVGFAITDDDILHLIMVAVEHQNKGYGAKLLAYIEEQMFTDFDSIMLQSFADNHATNEFYQKYGWTLANKQPKDDSPIRVLHFEKYKNKALTAKITFATMTPPEADKALSLLLARLSESLTAVYLHGSAVDGGLHPYSDVDLLAVVEAPLTQELRKTLAADLMSLSGRYPFDPNGRRPLEVIILRRDDLATPSYPARAEFIYGEWLRDEYESGKIPDSVCNPELTLIIAHARQNAKALHGPSVETLLPTVAKSDVNRAMRDALPSLMETLHGDERNVILTLARMWRTSEIGDFVPKDAAASWAEHRMPKEFAEVVRNARNAYTGTIEDSQRDCRCKIQRTAVFLRDCVMNNIEISYRV